MPRRRVPCRLPVFRSIITNALKKRQVRVGVRRHVGSVVVASAWCSVRRRSMGRRTGGARRRALRA